MPFLDQDASAAIPHAPLGPMGSPDVQAPSVSAADVIGAAFERENILGSGFRAVVDAIAGQDDEVSPGHNPLDMIRGTDYEQRHLWRFVGSRSRAETGRIMARIDREEANARSIERAGLGGMVASVVAGTLDPTIALPGGAIYRSMRGGRAALRSAVSVGAASAAGAAVQEGILQATQVTRDPWESAIGIGGAAILGGILGAGASGLLSRAERRAMANRMADDFALPHTADDIEVPVAPSARAAEEFEPPRPAPPREIPMEVQNLTRQADEIDGRVRAMREEFERTHAFDETVRSNPEFQRIEALAREAAAKRTEADQLLARAETSTPAPVGAAPSDTREAQLLSVGERFPRTAAAVGATVDVIRSVPLVGGGVARFLETMGNVVNGFSPLTRLLSSGNQAARRAAADLMESALETVDNARGITTTSGGRAPVSREVTNGIRSGVLEAAQAVDDLYARHYFGDGTLTAARRGQAFLDQQTGATNGRLTFAEFQNEIGRAMRRGDQHAVPEVQEAAQLIRERVFEPWKDRAIQAGLLPEDVEPTTAMSYFTRVYRREMIEAHRPHVVRAFTDWLEGEQARKLAIQGQLETLVSQRADLIRNEAKIEARLGRLQTRMSELEGQLQERALEASRGLSRADRLKERLSLIDEEASELEDFIRAMREEVRDPDRAIQLEQLQRDVRAWERAERDAAVTETDLDRIEAQERAGADATVRRILSDQTTRRAAEILSDSRRATTEQHLERFTLARSVARQGGIAETDVFSGELDALREFGISVRHGPDRLPLVQPKGATRNARTGPFDLDDLGERFLNDYGRAASWPYRNADGTARRMTPVEVREALERSARGDQPEWFLESLPDTVQTTRRALIVASQIEEAASRAGVRFEDGSAAGRRRAIARFLAGDLEIKPRDLDAIDRELLAMRGQEIPPSVRAEGARESLRVTEAEVTAAREALARGMEARARLQAREGRGKAALDEALLRLRDSFGTGRARKDGTVNEGRLGLLNSRLTNAEIRAELYEEALRLNRAEQGRLLDQAQVHLRDWGGNTAAEAVAAIKARDEAERVRQLQIDARIYQGRGERLTGADDATLTAVRRITGSDRELSRQELEARAEEIVNRIVSTPDGRMPYDVASASGAWSRGAVGGDGMRQDLRLGLRSRDFMIGDEVLDSIPIGGGRTISILEDNVEGVTHRFLNSIVPDLTLTERFGDVNMTGAIRKIQEDADARMRTASPEESTRIFEEREQAIRDLAGVRDRIRNVYGAEIRKRHPMLTRVFDALRNYNSLIFLGSAGLNSLPDLAGAVARYGVQNVFRDGWAPFFARLTSEEGAKAWQAIQHEARAALIGTETYLASRMTDIARLQEGYQPTTAVERGLQAGSQLMQVANLQTMWSDWTKTVAYAVSTQNILRAARAVSEGTATERQIADLASSNISPGMAERIWQQIGTHRRFDDINGTMIPRLEQWDQATRDAFTAAAQREVDITVVTPGQERPLWMSNPVLGLIGNLRTFSASATQRILLANLQRADGAALQGLIFSLGLGAAVVALGDIQRSGGINRERSIPDWIKEASNRAGWLGWLEEGNTVVSKFTGGGVDMYRAIGAERPLSRFSATGALSQLFGPTSQVVQNMTEVGRGVFGIGDAEFDSGTTSAIRRSAPFQNLWGLRLLLNEVEDAFNRSVGVEPRERQ